MRFFSTGFTSGKGYSESDSRTNKSWPSLTGQNIRVGPKHVLMSVSLQAVFTSIDGTAVLSCSAAGAAGKQQEFTITSPVVEIPGNVRAAVRIFDGKQASIDRLKTMTFFAALCPVVPDLYFFQVSFC